MSSGLGFRLGLGVEAGVGWGIVAERGVCCTAEGKVER